MALSVNAEKIRRYLAEHQGEHLTLQKIADGVDMKKRTVSRILKRLKDGGAISSTERGFTQVYLVEGCATFKPKDEQLADLQSQVEALRCKDIENNAKIEALTAALVTAQTKEPSVSVQAPLTESSTEPTEKQPGSPGEVSGKQSGSACEVAEKFRSVFGATVDVAPTDAAKLAAMEKMLGLHASGKLSGIRNPLAYLEKIVEGIPKASPPL